MSCGTALEARRNSDERWTFTPSSRNYTFSGMAPLFTVRRGENVLLQIDQTQTINGSLFSVVGDSVVLQLKKGDAALLDGPTPDTDAEALFYDVTLTDQTGFENWIVGGPFTLLGLNDVSCGVCSEKVEVTLGGQCIQINIEGGNLGIGASVNLAALNQAVQDAETAAGEAAQSAADAATAGATAGAAAGSTSGAAAGSVAGDAAGTAAAQAVVANKANTSLDNVLTADFGAKAVVPTSADTAQSLKDVVPLYLISNGAVPNVFDSAAGTANVAALNKAVTAGQSIDGKGAVFAIDGRWTASVVPHLKNATLRQIATTGTDRDYTVVIDGKNGFSLENVIIDLNDIPARSGVTFGNTAAIHIKNCSGFTIRNSRVINGGGHTGWLFENCSDVDFIDSDARDFDAVMAAQPTDDVACGVSWVNCSNVRISSGRPGDISASWPGQPSPRRLYTRGMSFSGCSDFNVRGVQVDFVDQGFDITGQPNHDLYFWNIGATDCSTFGFKASNRSYNIFVDGFEITRPGWAGTHVTSSVSSGATPYVQNIRFTGGRVRNCGENSIYTSSDGRNAYQIVHTGLTPGYPAGVVYDDCIWTDDQTVKTTDAGFAQRGTITPRTPTTTIPMNRVLPNCSGEGLAGSGVSQLGMNFPNATATGVSTPLALVTNTFTPLVFSVPVYDPSVMLDTANGRLYAPIDGDYDIFCNVTFANAAAGIGELFVFKNGSEVSANYRASSRLDPTVNIRVELVRPIRLLRGDYVSIQGRQQSGSNMNIALNGALFCLRLRNPFS